MFFSLVILGCTSLVAQIIMTRELIVSFYGNEFFIGWLLFSWLFWVGIGSLIIKSRVKTIKSLSLVLACHLLVAALIPLTIFWIRSSKSLFISTAGQIPDLMPALMFSFLSMAPLCLVFGVQFMAASAQGTVSMGMAYFYEAIGFVLGGLVFSYWLVFFNEFQAGSILIFLNMIAVFVLLLFEKLAVKKYFFITAALLAGSALICFLFSTPLNICSAALRFPREQLMETENSFYGNLAVTRTENQLNFYESGLVIGTDKDEAFNEYLVHLPMLSCKNPQKVLLIGAGFSGALHEILKYNPKQVFYAELDPALVDMACRHIPAMRQILDTGRVTLIKGDPRIALQGFADDLDVIIINLPNPSTGLINRYFTDDFFKEARRHLKPHGVISTHLVFAADSLSEPLGNLGACLYKTIQRNFKSVVILPEDVLFFLASPGELTRDPQELIRRLKERSIHNYFVTPPAIIYRYTTDRVALTEAVFKANTNALINTDLHPLGYLYNLIYWVSIFHQDLSSLLSSMMQTNYIFVLLLAMCLIVLLLLVKRKVFLAAMAMGGFSLMAAEVIVIYEFQVFYGHLFFKMAWIIAAFMAATALGAYVGNKNSSIKLGKLHLGLGACFLIWLFLPGFWIIGGLGTGVLAGLEFSYISQFQRKDIYAADLFGSCIGALGVSVFLIPAYGVYQTLLLLMIVNVMLAAVILIP